MEEIRLLKNKKLNSKAISKKKAMTEIKDCAGIQFA